MTSKKTFLTLACACVLLGCGKSEPEVDPLSPQAYMKDKGFMKKLEDRRQQRNSLLVRHMQLDEELQAEKAKSPTSEKVKDLQKRLDECDAEFEKNRRETYAIVRERLSVKKDGGNK